MKIPTVGPKIKVVESICGVTNQKLYEEGRKSMKKDLSFHPYPKIQEAYNYENID